VKLPSASLLLSRLPEFRCDLTNYRLEVLEANLRRVLRLGRGICRRRRKLLLGSPPMRYSRCSANHYEDTRMAEKTADASPFNWGLPLRAALVAFVVSISIAVCQADTALFLHLFFVAILIVFSVALLVYTVFAKGHRKRLAVLSTLATVWVVSASVTLFAYRVHIRTTARWLVWSHNYKDRVLAQQASANGEFRHVEWDGWGGQDTTVYLVFDPRDSLSSAASVHQSGKFEGIPCEVPEVSRLESHWYAVVFYTNQDWDRCN
jgi:hypothetical protein